MAPRSAWVRFCLVSRWIHRRKMIEFYFQTGIWIGMFLSPLYFATSRKRIGMIRLSAVTFLIIVSWPIVAIPVICIDTKERYESTKRAARLLDIPASTLRAHLSGKIEHAKCMRFEYC